MPFKVRALKIHRALCAHSSSLGKRCCRAYEIFRRDRSDDFNSLLTSMRIRIAHATWGAQCLPHAIRLKRRHFTPSPCGRGQGRRSLRSLRPRSGVEGAVSERRAGPTTPEGLSPQLFPRGSRNKDLTYHDVPCKLCLMHMGRCGGCMPTAHEANFSHSVHNVSSPLGVKVLFVPTAPPRLPHLVGLLAGVVLQMCTLPPCVPCD